MNDQDLLNHISSLVDQEHALFSRGELSESEQSALRGLEVKLDQLWDLLRQRRAKREYGHNPDEAEERSPTTVESYSNALYKGPKQD